MKDKMKIPFSPPDITELEINEVAETMRSGWITTGPKTKELERRIAEYIGVPNAVCLNSATACLELILRVLGIGPGDEVIVPAYTYTASASVIAHVGAKIVMVDSQGDSMEMCYEKMEEAITEKTKAIIAVDIGGRLCDYDKIFEAVERNSDKFIPNSRYQSVFNRVIVIADSAHGFGARRKGELSGRFADFTAFSFHAVKNLTTAEGGALVWKSKDGVDNAELYNEFMLASLHGQNKDALAKTKAGAWEYDIVYPAYKCNMTDIAAAIGLKQLDRYEKMLARRREIIEKYDRAFIPKGIIPLIHFDDDNQSSGHLYMVRIQGIDINQRNAIIEKMGDAGIACNVHYKPLPMLTAYKNLGFKTDDFPMAKSLYENEITLPLYSRLSDEETDYIIENFIRITDDISKG